MLERYGSDDPDQADPVVGKIILEFSKIDPGSYSYRYPVDRRGTPLSIAHSDLHLPTLSDVMSAVDGYFTGCDGISANFRNPSTRKNDTQQYLSDAGIDALDLASIQPQSIHYGAALP